MKSEVTAREAVRQTAGWYWLVFLLLIGTIATFIAAVVDGEFSLWPSAFLVGAIFATSHTGKMIDATGYKSISKKDKKDG